MFGFPSFLETVLFHADTLTATQRQTLHQQLLHYCERHTLAMVRLYERLGSLARGE